MKRIFSVLMMLSLLLFVGPAGISQTGNSQKKPEKKTEKKIAAKTKTVREGVGFDGISVGRSTAADVIKKYGKPTRVVKYKKYSAQMVYPGGISFYYCQAERKQTIFDIELRAPFKAKTSKGIVLSQSTLEDVYRIYGKSKDGLQYRGVSFFYQKQKSGKNVITVIDIVENGGIRQCSEAK